MINVTSSSPWIITNSSHNYYQPTPGIVRLNYANLEVQTPSGDWTYVPPSTVSVGLTPKAEAVLSWALDKMIEDQALTRSLNQPTADSVLSWAMSKMMEEEALTRSLNQSVGLPSGTKISETLQAQLNLVNQVSETVNKALIQLDKERKKLEVITQLSIDHDGPA